MELLSTYCVQGCRAKLEPQPRPWGICDLPQGTRVKRNGSGPWVGQRGRAVRGLGVISR